MKKQVVIISLAIIAFTTICSAQPASNLPKLSIPEKIIDFGSIPHGEIINFKFEIKNIGAGDLKLLSIKPDKGLNDLKFPDTIKTNSKGYVVGTFDTSNLAGLVDKNITVVTNEPKNKNLKLCLKVKITPIEN